MRRAIFGLLVSVGIIAGGATGCKKSGATSLTSSTPESADAVSDWESRLAAIGSQVDKQFDDLVPYFGPDEKKWDEMQFGKMAELRTRLDELERRYQAAKSIEDERVRNRDFTQHADDFKGASELTRARLEWTQLGLQSLSVAMQLHDLRFNLRKDMENEPAGQVERFKEWGGSDVHSKSIEEAIHYMETCEASRYHALTDPCLVKLASDASELIQRVDALEASTAQIERDNNAGLDGQLMESIRRQEVQRNDPGQYPYAIPGQGG